MKSVHEKKHKMGWLLALTAVIVSLGASSYKLYHADISALADPGPFETSTARRIRNWLVGRAARAVPGPNVRDDAASISQGKALYDMDCASCHGEDGRNSTPIGRSLYPRAADLSSMDVQNKSDRQLFWIVKNGIRLSGMPGFGRIDTDEDIWKLTYYLRTLNNSARNHSELPSLKAEERGSAEPHEESRK